MTKAEWTRVLAEGDAVDRAAADAMLRGEAPESPAAQAVMAPGLAGYLRRAMAAFAR